jgi:hypothetical protein
MAEDWSHEEVEVTVADYFDMLDKELRGLEYNKTAHRRRLAGLLKNRSDSAIERKHQNISAALNDLGFPYITGYKPLSNYQLLLFAVVSDRLEKSLALTSVVRDQVNLPIVLPKVDDILSSLVDPPTPSTREYHSVSFVRDRAPTPRHVDYLSQEASNGSLGLAGERFVIEFEKERLIRARKERLAAKIEHISATRGDSAGFDILSFDDNGRERFIEVKTTAYGSLTPFFVTRNELDTSRKADAGYYLYRAFEFRRRPKLFAKQGPLDRSFSLDPSQYVAKLA